MEGLFHRHSVLKLPHFLSIILSHDVSEHGVLESGAYLLDVAARLLQTILQSCMGQTRNLVTHSSGNNTYVLHVKRRAADAAQQRQSW